MFNHLKKVEMDFNTQKAMLVKENMDLKDNVEMLRGEVMEQARRLMSLQKDNNVLRAKYAIESEVLKEQNSILLRQVNELREKPLVEQVKDALQGEKDRKMKKFLEKVLYSIVLVKSGKSIELEPIVVAKEQAPSPEKRAQEVKKPKIEKPSTPAIAGKKGKVLSIDRRYSLIVIDLGKRDDIKEGDACTVLKNSEEIAFARIISVRYKVAAAFVSEMNYKYNIRDIEEEDDVVIAK